MGAFPCLCLKNPCDKVPFLCLEVLCCTICAVTSNRAYIQRTKGVMNDRCDDCLIWCTCICQWVLCILEILGQPVDPSLENAVDCFYCQTHSTRTSAAPPQPAQRSPSDRPPLFSLLCRRRLALLDTDAGASRPQAALTAGLLLSSLCAQIVVGCMLTQQDLEIDADQPAPQPQVMGQVVNPMGNPAGVKQAGPTPI